MQQNILAAALVIASAAPSFAEPLANGKYSGTGDGTKMYMTVSGERAEILMTGQGCVGGGTGHLSELTDGRWLITMTEHGQCLVDVTRNGDGFLLEPRVGGECSSYGGQACGFYGNLTQD